MIQALERRSEEYTGGVVRSAGIKLGLFANVKGTRMNMRHTWRSGQDILLANFVVGFTDDSMSVWRRRHKI